METLEYDHTMMTSDAGDKKLFVQFYNFYVQNMLLSEKEGRYVAQDEAFIKIHVPGDRTNVVDRPVRPGDQYRFPEQWARFKNGEAQRAAGTPLVDWPIISRGQAEELKYLGFTTVEQIADAKDGISYMGLQDLKNKAKMYLEIAKGNGAPTEAMAKEQKELREQNKVLAESVEFMKTEIAALKSAKGK